MRKDLFVMSLLVSTGIFAQTVEERKEIQQNIDVATISQLQTLYKNKYTEQQNAIAQFLMRNPLAEKSFVKNGNAYLLHHIDADGNPIYINTKDNNQINNTKSYALYNGGSLGVNITGNNMVAGIWDGGQVNANHELLVGQVNMQSGQTVNSAGGNNHMQAVSGIMVGKSLSTSANPDGLGLTAKGIAYDATTQNYDWDNDIAEMTTFSSGGYLISNHSYGYSNTTTNNIWNYGAYDETAKDWDMLLKATPNYLPFVAVGNERQTNGNSSAGGFDVITGSSAAKNVMTVGAVNLDNTMSDYSNWGPTDDGRVKPDIVTLGTAINVPLYTGNSSYTGVDVSSSGTSYAAPAAAAAGLLLQQYYKSIFGSYMSSASLKALLLHTADDAGNPGPDAKFGWGILNVERAAQTIKQMQNGGSAKLVQFTTNPTNNSSSEVSVSGVQSAGGSLRASICWTDDEGTEQTSSDGVNNTTSRLVYNFDMLFRNYSSTLKNAYSYAPLSVTNPNATASVSTSWFNNNVDNYKQANISTSDVGSITIVYIRKSTTSPAPVRGFCVLITGLKITNATLVVADTNTEKNIVFYNQEQTKLQMISNKTQSFGEYKIYDISGKLIQSGNELTKEILFNNPSKGVFILVYNTTETLKFKN